MSELKQRPSGSKFQNSADPPVIDEDGHLLRRKRHNRLTPIKPAEDTKVTLNERMKLTALSTEFLSRAY